MARVVLAILIVLCTMGLPAPEWCAAQADKEAATTAEPERAGRGLGYEVCEPGEECPNTFGPIFSDTAVPIEKGKFAIQPTWSVAFITDTFSPSWRRVSAGGDYSSFNQIVKLSYGLWDNLEVFLEMNTYEHRWARNVNEPGPKGETTADFGSIGNTFLVCKYQFVQETPKMPVVTGFFGTVFPTGHYRYFNPSRLGTDQIANGGFQFVTGVNLQKFVQPFILYGNIWYRLGTSFKTDGEDAAGNPTQVQINPRNSVIVNIAAEYPLTPKWVALLEVVSNWDTGLHLAGATANQPRGTSLAVSPGIEYMATEKLCFALGVAVDCFGKNTEAAVRPTLSMVYAF